MEHLADLTFHNSPASSCFTPNAYPRICQGCEGLVDEFAQNAQGLTLCRTCFLDFNVGVPEKEVQPSAMATWKGMRMMMMMMNDDDDDDDDDEDDDDGDGDGDDDDEEPRGSLFWCVLRRTQFGLAKWFAESFWVWGVQMVSSVVSLQLCARIQRVCQWARRPGVQHSTVAPDPIYFRLFAIVCPIVRLHQSHPGLHGPF